MFDNIHKIFGEPIDKLTLSDDKEKFTIHFLDGNSQSFRVTGDCCSHSWIEHLEIPKRIKGSVITKILEDNILEPWDKHECKKKENYEYENVCGHDVLRVYHTIFRTDKGDIVLEYRNDSNGYYGGDLEVC